MSAPDSVAELLLRAADVMAERGLLGPHQGYVAPSGEVTVGGALWIALGATPTNDGRLVMPSGYITPADDALVNAACDAVHRFLGLSGDDDNNVTTWGDPQVRSTSHVADVLRAAAETVQQ